MTVSKVGRRGQVTLPRTVRRWLNVREGDHVAFIRLDDGIILLPLTQTLLDLRGSVPVAGPQDFAAIRRQVIETHARKVAEVED